MLPRSTTTHIRDQNGFAVGIDFLIVMRDIQLAFQKLRAHAPGLLQRAEIPAGGDR